MIYAKLHGRLGNIMFIAAAAASIAAEQNQNFCLACHKDYKVENGCYMWDYIQKFKDNILRGIEIVPEVPVGIKTIKQNGCFHSEYDFTQEDFVIDGAFQSYKFFNPDVVQKLFYSDAILNEIKELNHEAFSEPVTSVHIRRGDYCTMPHKLPPVSCSFVKRAMRLFPKETRFLFISDDLEYCRRNFHGENIYFMEGSTVLRDIFAPTLCENNIISNSTFGWWGAYLNPNPDKTIIVPKPWFGKFAKNSNSDVKDLIPDNWIQIPNHLDWNLWIKAKKLGWLTSFGVIR